MRRMRLRARGVAVRLGLVAALGFGGVAAAESPPCTCTARNQRVEFAPSCLRIVTNWGCFTSMVRNDCGVPVTLVDWPIASDTCRSASCTVELQRREEAFFNFPDMQSRPESASMQASYRVKVGDGEEQPLTLFADIQCSTPTPEKDSGCAAAPGALAALGVLLLTVPVARWRRRG